MVRNGMSLGFQKNKEKTWTFHRVQRSDEQETITLRLPYDKNLTFMWAVAPVFTASFMFTTSAWSVFVVFFFAMRIYVSYFTFQMGFSQEHHSVVSSVQHTSFKNTKQTLGTLCCDAEIVPCLLTHWPTLSCMHKIEVLLKHSGGRLKNANQESVTHAVVNRKRWNFRWPHISCWVGRWPAGYSWMWQTNQTETGLTYN